MILHLVPRVYPAIDGIGDYALNLAFELRRLQRLESSMIIADPSWNGPALYEGVPLSALARRDESALCESLGDASKVIVHYVCYGYQKRGVPMWLDRGLRQWRLGQGREARLVLIFHEIWASGPPWRSEFYLGWWQKILVARMHRLASVSVTSASVMKHSLDAIEPSKTWLLPIPGNLPFSAWTPRIVNGRLCVIFFGQQSQREHSVRAHSTLVKELHAAGLLREVRVVGKNAGSLAQPSPEVMVLLGFLPVALVTVASNVSLLEAAEHFRAADIFLSFYPAEFACKSTAFMAALACGCVPVLKDGINAFPLKANEHFLVADGGSESVRQLGSLLATGRLAAISEQGYRWYRDNADWPIIAKEFAKIIEPDSAVEAESLNE